MIEVPTSIENNGDEQQHFCATLRWRSFLAALSAAVHNTMNGTLNHPGRLPKPL
jgi:hypothetical protein